MNKEGSLKFGIIPLVVIALIMGVVLVSAFAQSCTYNGTCSNPPVGMKDSCSEQDLICLNESNAPCTPNSPFSHGYMCKTPTGETVPEFSSISMILTLIIVGIVGVLIVAKMRK